MADVEFNPGGATDLNDAVRKRAGLAAVANGRVLGRASPGAGLFEQLTAEQLTALLVEATTLLQGAMSAADKAKLDATPSLGVSIALTSGEFII